MAEARTIARGADPLQLIWGRSGRMRYWVGAAAYFAIYFAATFARLPPTLTQIAAPLGWIALVAAPRLHDFGKSGWWGFTPMAVGFVGGFAASYWKATSGPTADLLAQVSYAELLVVGAASLAFMIWLGVRRGDNGPNRFGHAPGAAAPSLADVFD